MIINSHYHRQEAATAKWLRGKNFITKPMKKSLSRISEEILISTQSILTKSYRKWIRSSKLLEPWQETLRITNVISSYLRISCTELSVMCRTILDKVLILFIFWLKIELDWKKSFVSKVLSLKRWSKH